VSENSQLSPINPYGLNKLIVEKAFQDKYISNPDWSIINLRYFNAFGAHPSGIIGEDIYKGSNNLMPKIARVALDINEELYIYGDDYETDDGTCVRDYIHVMDLADAHVIALEKLTEKQGVKTYNLGTGKGYSVLEMVKAFEEASGKKINYKSKGRRDGDPDTSIADIALVEKEFGWKAKYNLQDMCEDTWRWLENNFMVNS